MKIFNLAEALEWEAALTPKPDPDLRNQFDCGEDSLNLFLRQYARQSDKQNVSRSWILIDTNNHLISGFVSLSNTSVEKIEIQEIHKSNVNPIPALLIGRLAVDSRYKGQGLGEKLLMFAFEKALEINRISAIQIIAVDALNENAERFYRQYGFQKVGHTQRMILSTKELSRK